MAISVCCFVKVFGTSAEPVVGGFDREVTDLADVLAADLHRERLRLQAVAVASVAGLGGLVAAELFAHPVAVRLLEAARDVADHALEGFLGRVVARAVASR